MNRMQNVLPEIEFLVINSIFQAQQKAFASTFHEGIIDALNNK